MRIDDIIDGSTLKVHLLCKRAAAEALSLVSFTVQNNSWTGALRAARSTSYVQHILQVVEGHEAQAVLRDDFQGVGRPAPVEAPDTLLHKDIQIAQQTVLEWPPAVLPTKNPSGQILACMRWLSPGPHRRRRKAAAPAARRWTWRATGWCTRRRASASAAGWCRAGSRRWRPAARKLRPGPGCPPASSSCTRGDKQQGSGRMHDVSQPATGPTLQGHKNGPEPRRSPCTTVAMPFQATSEMGKDDELCQAREACHMHTRRHNCLLPHSHGIRLPWL